MDMKTIQSQMHHNAAAITTTYGCVIVNKDAMKFCVELQDYAHARMYQKEYKYWNDKLRSLVACQKALKEEKRVLIAAARQTKVIYGIIEKMNRTRKALEL